MNMKTTPSVPRARASAKKRAPAKRSKKSEAAIARRNEFVTKYYGCVEKVARRLARRLPSHIDLGDLISAGAVGLIEAAERFDPARCSRFESFAKMRIRGAMLDDLRARDTLSRDMRRISNELSTAATAIANQLGRTPTEGEVADHMGVAVQEVQQRRSKLAGAQVVGLDDADPHFWEHVADEAANDPAEMAARRELYRRLVRHIEALPEKLQQVLSLYYCDGLSLREIGTVLGVTESRICQLHADAARRLRSSLGESFMQEAAA
jgi:RNA polymerase sigma factor for flagellar operon FliA